jgi:hypothetical protein
MPTATEKPFATIESSLEFLHLLRRAITETVADVEQDLTEARNGSDQRYREALQLVQYKLSQLSMHVHKSEKLLTDLRRLRRAMLPVNGNGNLKSRAVGHTAP